MLSGEDEDECQCPICFEDFEENDIRFRLPRTFPCLAHHTYCSGCIRELEVCSLCGSLPLVEQKETKITFSPNLVLIQKIRFKKLKNESSPQKLLLPFLGTTLVCLGAYTAKLMWRCYYSTWSTLIVYRTARIIP